ncbi:MULTISPECIES: hypothetical protein [Sinorhizobium]|uniref:hypothetical protein n=1 Tax=Sinorhizobium TaxID=28105 RepID=UPI000BEA5F74|nr:MULTISPECIES: hypothetical protein [Sinorhizobium]PDT55027.1 hypothetical protein CO664_08115 [Sinorhizobium sp. NG07B]POH32069.1 hypothetical protein ATY30_11755 [Sinorhizobium americanum]
MVELAATIFSDGPSSNPDQPMKPRIREWGTWIEGIIAAFTSNGGLIYDTRAELFADTSFTENRMAWVIADPTVGYNGVYGFDPATDVWDRKSDLPFSFIIASDTGAGSPNAIQATTSIPIPGSALVWMNIADSNTSSPVTVSFNGDSALTIKTNSGTDVAAGGLSAGMIVMGIVTGLTFRLLSDQQSAAIVAAAEAARDAAQAAAASVNIKNVATRSALKALNTAVTTLAFLGETGRYGTFAWRAGDYSTHIAADTQEAVYIKADAISASAGAWVRQHDGWLRPEWFGAVGNNSADCGPAFRKMFALGIFLGAATFSATPGAIYRFSSPDPVDVNQAYAIAVLNVAVDIHIQMRGARFVITNSIRSAAAIAAGTPGTLFRFESVNIGEATGNGQKFHVDGGFYDSTQVAASTEAVQTIGIFSVVGNFNMICENATFYHGVNAPSGENVGVGGGDQSFFLSGFASASFVSCDFIGPPDLAIYASNSVGKYMRVVACRFYCFKAAIGIKRFSGYYIVLGCVFERGDIAIYEPVADGLTTNNGGIGIISNNIFRKIQTRPIDISARSDRSRVTDNIIEDFGRRYSDGGELAVVEQISGVRVRAWWVNVSDNWIGLADWTLGTTAGKEQVGVTFGYDGSHAKGANNCVADENTFFGLYRRVVYQANTSGNSQRNNKGISVSQPDSDSGQNNLPISLPDGQATSVMMPSNRCVVLIESQSDAAGFPNGHLWVNTTGAPTNPVPMGFITTTNISFTTGALANGGGVASNITFSAHSDGRLYIANRTGGTKLLKVSFIDR